MNKNLQILCVDDSTVMRVVIKRSLHRLGHGSVTMESDGESAFAAVKDRPFDVVLTDCCMPGMSGLDLLRNIRAEAGLRRLPVIMISGNFEPELVHEARRAGVNGFLTKPFSDEELGNALELVFEQPAALAA